jgi:hypothetical protein
MANLLVPRMYGHGEYAVRYNLRKKADNPTDNLTYNPTDSPTDQAFWFPVIINKFLLIHLSAKLLVVTHKERQDNTGCHFTTLMRRMYVLVNWYRRY